MRILLCIFALCFAGCYPVERIWWSPDGEQALVVAGEKPQLHLVKSDGEFGVALSGVAIDDDYPFRASWLPDGSGFVVHRVRSFAAWEEARTLLPPDEAAEIERHAPAIPHLLQAAGALAAEPDAVEALLSAISDRDKDMLMAAFNLAIEKDRAAVEAGLKRVPKGAEMLAGRGEKPFQVHEVCLFKVKQERPDQEPQVIGRSIHPLVLPVVSPKHSAVAWWKVIEDHKVELVVSSLDGKTQVGVGSTSSVTFDWTPDGRALVFPVSVSEGDRLLQTIRRITALDETGSLLKENRESLDLAVAIMPEPARLCVLPDGGVLFASQPAKLPALSSALDLEPRLFHISSDGKVVHEVPTAPGDLPANLSFFVPSPDGKRVAVVESDTVVVAVVELATGKTEIVAPPRAGWGCRTMPAWKSSSELTFAALDATGAPKWMRWKQGEGVRSISEKWPAAATRNWLDEKKDANKRATN
jgi:hypothetical protein